MAKKPTKTESSQTDIDPATPEADGTDAHPAAQSADDQVIEDAVVVQEQAPDSAESPQIESAPPQPAVAKAGTTVVPMILAGIVCAAAGFGAAYLVIPRVDPALASDVANSQATLTELGASLQDIDRRLADLDVNGAVAGAVASLTAQLTEATTAQNDDLAALAERVTALEGLPTIEGGMSPAAMNDFEAQIAQLKAEIETQQENMAAMAASTTAQLEETRASAAAIEESAANKAMTVAATAALAQIRGALEAGAPYAAALPDLTAAVGPLPAALVEPSNDGVPTLASLQESFADAARLALAAAREQGVAGESSGGLVAFLRTQFDIRSVTPQDGDDVDAILSRIGAALAGGDLVTVLTEADTLPDVAHSELADWLVLASLRSDALDALDSINLTQN